MRSTRRTGSAEKFWMVSANTLPLPTMVSTLSGVTMVVPNSPSSCTVPVMPPMLDEVADLEGPQDQHEGAGGEVAEHAAPGGADRHAGAGQHRGERRGLDAEVAEDAEHQRDVQRDGDDRAEVLGQRRVDVVAAHRRLHQRDHPADQPAADDPEGDRGEDLDAELGGGGAQECWMVCTSTAVFLRSVQFVAPCAAPAPARHASSCMRMFVAVRKRP